MYGVKPYPLNCIVDFVVFRLSYEEIMGWHQWTSTLHHEIWGVQTIVKIGNHVALIKLAASISTFKLVLRYQKKVKFWWLKLVVDVVLMTSSIQNNSSLRNKENNTPQQNCMKWSHVRDENAKKKREFLQRSRCVQDTQTDPILRKGSRTQFSFEETIIVFLQHQTPPIGQPSTLPSLHQVCHMT